MPDARQAKAALRQRIKDALAATSPEQRAAWSKAICERVGALAEFAGAGTVMLYAPMARWREVDVEPLARAALAAGKRVALPRLGPLGGEPTLEPALVRNWDLDVVEGGPPLPRFRGPRADAPAVAPAEIDVVVVPGLAFDASGRRLGRGGGYYDRFLTLRTIPPHLRRIAVAFEVQVVGEVPTDPHDQRVEMVVTQDRIVRVAPQRS